VIFDRSWYNRAGVERVMGFASDEQVERFLKMIPAVERAIVESGVILLKYWLEVSMEEQTRRLKARIDDGRKLLEALADGPEVVQPLVRLLARPGRHVQATDTSWCAVVRGAFGRQEACAAEHHPPHPASHPL
jgi:hypothetical protein